MQQEFKSAHHVDENGNPAGGFATATGIGVVFQSGPLQQGERRLEPNGAFVETLLAIAKDRLTFYQDGAGGKFSCTENAQAIEKIDEAIAALNERTRKRTARGVEGTHNV